MSLIKTTGTVVVVHFNLGGEFHPVNAADAHDLFGQFLQWTPLACYSPAFGIRSIIVLDAPRFLHDEYDFPRRAGFCSAGRSN